MPDDGRGLAHVLFVQDLTHELLEQILQLTMPRKALLGPSTMAMCTRRRWNSRRNHSKRVSSEQ